MTLTATQLRQIMPFTGAVQLKAFLAPLNSAMAEHRIDTPTRMAAFLAQIAHESGELRRTVESLDYSAQSLRATWPSRFSAALAEKIGRTSDHPADQEAIANRAYCNRMGNGSEASGDGWRYRGRCLIQLTGKANYAELGKALAVDLVNHPELLEEPELACRSAAYFWASRGCNALSDAGDFVAITRKINGRINGMAERQRYWRFAKSVLAG